MSKEIMQQLREARKARRMRQREIAQVLGLSSDMVAKIERGVRRPKLDQVIVWAALVGLRLVLERVEGEQ